MQYIVTPLTHHKVYRIQLRAFSTSERILFVQKDESGISGGMRPTIPSSFAASQQIVWEAARSICTASPLTISTILPNLLPSVVEDQLTCDGLIPEFNCQKFKPRASVTKQLSEKVRGAAIAQAEALFG